MEKRSREPWSQDPRNTRWSNDKSKFGYRMLEKMGWKEGKGLGAEEGGSTEHIPVQQKDNLLGLGARRGRDDEWIETVSAYDKMLAELSSKKRARSPELQDGLPRKKQMSRYKKVLQSKDLSLKSSVDLDCVLGRKPKRTKTTHCRNDDLCPHEKDLCKDDPHESDPDSHLNAPHKSDPHERSMAQQACKVDIPQDTHGITTVTGKLSVGEYFAAKLRSRRTNTSGSSADPCPNLSSVDPTPQVVGGEHESITMTPTKEVSGKEGHVMKGPVPKQMQTGSVGICKAKRRKRT